MQVFSILCNEITRIRIVTFFESCALNFVIGKFFNRRLNLREEADGRKASAGLPQPDDLPRASICPDSLPSCQLTYYCQKTVMK